MTSHANLTLTLAAKDWRLFWADRRAALLCFIVPIVLASAFGMIFNRPTPDATATKLPILVVIEDDGPFTAQVAADLLTSPKLDAKASTQSEAEAALPKRRPTIAVVLPKGFEKLRDWQPSGGGDRPTVRILHHPTASMERQWAEGVVTEIVMRRLARSKFGGFVGADEAAFATPFQVDATAVSAGTSAKFNSYSHSFCGMTLQYLLFWGMESGLLFLRERQRGVWKRTRAAPVPLGCVLAGKTLSTAAIALLQVFVTFGFGYFVFGVQVTGSFTGFVLLALAACGLAAATGLLVAAIGGTEARARSVSILVILGISMIGGLWLPTFLLPEWVRDTALSLPTSWAMRGLGGVTWEGLGLRAVLPNVAMVTAFAVVFLAIAVLRLKSDERRLRQGNV
ncbi:MAG: ABC transporter permease [Planctomycetes bacterium]|nr:ABC transporter permease [Planctomycetota bacterium]